MRLDAQHHASLAQQAHDTLTRLEEQLTSCDQSPTAHRAALVLHKQQLTADKSHRDELTDRQTDQHGAHHSKNQEDHRQLTTPGLPRQVMNPDGPSREFEVAPAH